MNWSSWPKLCFISKHSLPMRWRQCSKERRCIHERPTKHSMSLFRLWTPIRSFLFGHPSLVLPISSFILVFRQYIQGDSLSLPSWLVLRVCMKRKSSKRRPCWYCYVVLMDKENKYCTNQLECRSCWWLILREYAAVFSFVTRSVLPDNQNIKTGAVTRIALLPSAKKRLFSEQRNTDSHVTCSRQERMLKFTYCVIEKLNKPDDCCCCCYFLIKSMAWHSSSFPSAASPVNHFKSDQGEENSKNFN